MSAVVLAGCSGALSGGPTEADQLAPESSSLVEATAEPFGFPDLEGVPQQSLEALSAADPLAQTVSSWSLREKVASLFLVHLPGTNVEAYQELVGAEPVAGFLLLGDNLPSSQQQARDFVSEVRTLSDRDLLIAVDEEGGAVQRLTSDPSPSALELGGEQPEATTDAARARNQLVFDVGANVNLGVVADVSPGEDAYIHPRSFGSNTQQVSERVVAALEGSRAGVAEAVKHFPGHGLTTEDTHQGIGLSEIDFEQWRDIHAPPFQAAIDQQVDLVMMGHLTLPAIDDLPASLSSQWVDFLRNQWGYQGVIVTDDLSMLEDSGDERFEDPATNAVFALASGADLVIDTGGLTVGQTMSRLGDQIDAVIEAINRGEISEESIEESARRVLGLRDLLGGVVRPLEDAELSQLDG